MKNDHQSQLDNPFTSILKEAREGSESAIGDLLGAYRNYLLTIANQEMGNQYQSKVGASDAVQSTLLHAQQNLKQFRGATAEELIGWLRNILRNQIRTTHRRFSAEKRDVSKEQQASSQLIDQQRTPNTEAVMADDAKRLRGALQQLPEDQRNAIILRNWEQLPFSEIGRRMQRSEQAARKLWERAIEALKKEMNHGG